MSKKKLSTGTSVSITRPATAASIGQNVKNSLARVRSVPNAGGTGLLTQNS